MTAGSRGGTLAVRRTLGSLLLWAGTAFHPQPLRAQQTAAFCSFSNYHAPRPASPICTSTQSQLHLHHQDRAWGGGRPQLLVLQARSGSSNRGGGRENDGSNPGGRRGSNDRNGPRKGPENNAFRRDGPGPRRMEGSSQRGESKRTDAARQSQQDENEAATGIRINKVFARFASRREADRMVLAGRVSINGKVAEAGSRVVAGDKVTLDGKPVAWEGPAAGNDRQRQSGGDWSPQPAGPLVYLKYWKPKGVVCTTDESVANNIIDAIGHRQRIFPVGRLDKDSTGLILLTNDGRVPNAVLRTERGYGKEYVVSVHRQISDACLGRLSRGIIISTPVQRDRVDKLVTARTLPCDVRRLDARTFVIVLKEGRNRQIRRMCEALGYEVLRLHRMKVMSIGLTGLKRAGEWKELDEQEVMSIEQAIQLAGQQRRSQQQQEEEGEEPPDGEEDDEE